MLINARSSEDNIHYIFLECNFFVLDTQETMGKGLADEARIGLFNWLCRSIVADNPILVVAAAQDVGCRPRKAVEVRSNLSL